MSKPPLNRTKVVVRNLPPTLTEEAFRTTIDKLVEGKYNWLSYFPGKVSLKRTLHARAYLNFITPESVFEFKDKFDGHVFVSKKGTQYKCQVEYAPFQKVPNPQKKKVAMEGTIEKDPDYQAFVRSLEEGPTILPSATAQLEAREAEAKAAGGSAPGIIITPLMEFLQKKYQSMPFKRGSKSRRKDRLEVVEEVCVAGFWCKILVV
eukprot:jgi/Chrzof1/1567/Cz10g12210.t1